MFKYVCSIAIVILVCGSASAQAPDTSTWPPNTDFSQEVHFWAADYFLPIPSDSYFVDTLTVLTGGDQATEDVVIGGLGAKKDIGPYLNVADEYFDVWPDVPVVDVLILYFANAESKAIDTFAFLIGQLTNQIGVSDYEGEQYIFESVTDEFEWRLFRIDNSEGRIGDLFDPSIGGTTYGGVNGGTIRFEQVPGLIVRAVAFGPQGVFGEPEEINISGAIEFDPDLYPIMAEWDLNKGTVNGLDLYRVTGGDQETIEADNIGPADDKRKAARPAMDDGTDGAQDQYVNWEILDEYFGPTSQPSTRVKMAAEYYDDPALAGETFGPEAYTTAGGDVAFYPPDRRTVLEGTDTWREAVWYVTDVKLEGINVPGSQAAARFHFTAPIFISRMRVGILRTSGINENADPIPDVYPFDPDPYDIYAELDINEGIEFGLLLGCTGGDQQWWIDEGIGPAGDQRAALRPALDEGDDFTFDRYVNFQLETDWFGPTDQPNAVLKIAVDYYDDPALVGQTFGPEVYQSEVFGQLQFKFVPTEFRVALEGTDTWRVAAWQVDDVNFSGVNCSPAAIRFAYSDAGAIYISRVRYAVIRPVGENAGVDMLADVPVTDVENWELH